MQVYVDECNTYLYACSEERNREVKTKEVALAEMDIGIQNFKQRYPDKVKEEVEKVKKMVCQLLYKTQ